MISVVVPVYNVEKYLPNCIESIIHQTYKDIEIILINDGSTDNSPIICKQYAKIDSRISVYDQKNGGLSTARNTGIGKAKGQYITFIDSDDEIKRDMLAYLFELIQKADIAVCQRQSITESGELIIEKLDAKSRIIHGNEACMREFFVSRDIDTVAWGKLYKTTYFNKVRYPIGKYHEDIFTTYLLIAQCDSIAIGSERKYLYRQRDTGISKITFTNKHLDSVKGNLERTNYIKQHYPKLLYLAESGIIYSSNICSLRMAKAGVFNKNIINNLQQLYKKYELSFLKGRSSIQAKIFSICAWMNLEYSIKAYFYMWRIRNIFNK